MSGEEDVNTQQIIDACEKCIEDIENENNIKNLKKAVVLILKIISVELNSKLDYEISEGKGIYFS